MLVLRNNSCGPDYPFAAGGSILALSESPSDATQGRGRVLSIGPCARFVLIQTSATRVSAAMGTDAATSRIGDAAHAGTP